MAKLGSHTHPWPCGTEMDSYCRTHGIRKKQIPKGKQREEMLAGENSRYLALQTEFPILMKTTVECSLNLKQRQNSNIEKAKRKPGLKFAVVSNPKSRVEWDRSKAAENYLGVESGSSGSSPALLLTKRESGGLLYLFGLSFLHLYSGAGSSQE